MGSNTQFNGYVRSRYWYQTAKTNCATTPAPSPLSLHDEMQKVPSSATASPTGNPTAGTDAPALSSPTPDSGNPSVRTDAPEPLSATAVPTSQPTSSPAALTILFRIVTPMSSADVAQKKSEIEGELAGLIGITHDRVEVSHSAAQGWLIVQVGSSVGEAANDLEKIPAEQLAGRPAFSGFPLNSPAERIDASVLAASNSASQQQPGIRRLVGWRAGRHRRRL